MHRLSTIIVYFWFIAGLSGSTDWSPSRMQGEIILDGLIDEVAWQHLQLIPMVQQSPEFEAPSKMKTEMKIGYDGQFIYIGARCLVNDPSEIISNTKKRDALTAATDWVGVVFDSYNDNENGLVFYVNPNGVRWDAAVFNDAIGNLPINLDWNTFWNVATSRDDKGWYAEIRIPWSSLNISSTEGVVDMGIIASRWSAFHNENDIFPAIAPEWGDWSGMKPSVAHDAKFEGIKRKKPFYVAPYILAGVEVTRELNEVTNSYPKQQNNRLEPGLDAKIGITENLTLDLSANTDFAQVEVDDQQINLTRFSLFFPEKRLFFQERAGIFNFTFGRQNNLFYSRRIGIDDGSPVRIFGGARLVGKIGKTNVGFLNMHAESENSTKGKNFAVARLQKPILNGRSTAGLMVLNSTNLKGEYNTSYGVDAIFRYGKSQEFSIKWAQTFGDSMENKPLSLDPTHFFITFAKRSERGFNYGSSISRAGKDFNPEMGFQQREDYFRIAARLEYGFFPEKSTFIFKHGPTISFSRLTGLSSGLLETFSGRASYQMATKSGFNVELTYSRALDRVEDTFDLTDNILIAPEVYRNPKIGILASTPMSRSWQLAMEAEKGQLYGYDLTNVTCTPTWAVSSSLEISGTYIYNRLQSNAQDFTDILHLARLKALVMISTEFSIASFIQINTQSKKTGANIRLRYNPREGNDLYIVYNTGKNLDVLREAPNLPKNEFSSFLLKYTYTFVL